MERVPQPGSLGNNNDDHGFQPRVRVLGSSSKYLLVRDPYSASLQCHFRLQQKIRMKFLGTKSSLEKRPRSPALLGGSILQETCITLYRGHYMTNPNNAKLQGKSLRNCHTFANPALSYAENHFFRVVWGDSEVGTLSGSAAFVVVM